MKKYMPQQRSIETKHHLDGQPGRDHESLILPMSIIKLSKNIRLDVDEEEIRQLAASIEQNGLINPITIRKTDEGSFEIVAGTRRYLALQKLGRKDAPVRIKNINQDQAAILKLAENLDRADLTGWEVCQAVYNLLPICGDSQTKVAELIKRDRSYVSRCVAVVDAKPDVSRVKQLSLRELFRLFAQGSNSSSRKPSGPIPGGRSVERVVAYRERRQGQAFSLRVNFDFDKTSVGDRERLLKQLKDIVKKLESR